MLDVSKMSRWIAVGYAVVVVLLIGLNVLAIATQSPEAWRKVVGQGAVGFVAAAIPLLALKLSDRFVSNACGRRAVDISVIAACMLLPAAIAMLSFSAEPLAMLALLYVPPAQALALALVVAGAALGGRG